MLKFRLLIKPMNQNSIVSQVIWVVLSDVCLRTGQQLQLKCSTQSSREHKSLSSGRPVAQGPLML